jgi:hypothetical protein
LPFGGVLENADDFTLAKALENKQILKWEGASGGDKKMMTLTEKWKLDGKLETLRENIIRRVRNSTKTWDSSLRSEWQIR